MAPRTKEKLLALKEIKRQTILEAALKIFVEYGFNGATVGLIAEKASISKGLIYTYFKSKEALLEELLTFGLEKAAVFLTSSDIPLPSDKPSFARSLKAMLELFRSEDDFWRLYSMLILQKNMQVMFEKKVGTFMKQYLSIYARYFEQNGSPYPIAEAMLFGAVLDGLMFDLMIAPTHYPIDEVMDVIINKFA